jgi:hypothetical protein
MLVLKSTHEQMKAEAKASGKALSELVGELIEGLQTLGFDPEPRHAKDTTAAIVLRALRGALSDAASARIERNTAQDERDGYREDALKHRSSRSHLKQYRGSGSAQGHDDTASLNA